MKPLSVAILLLSIIAILHSGCRDDNFVDDPSTMLSFSTDTLTFDTVFVTLGSVTGQFRIYNNLKNPVKISEINLLRNGGDQFRINVDGITGDNFKDVVVPGNDSLYVFVQVTVDPTQQDLPFVIGDDVEFIINGNRQIVHLMAWGQNANFYLGEKICDEVWDDTKPYVVKSRVDPQTGEFNIGVQVEKGCTLTIMPGTHVYFDGNSSGMSVFGTLQILGTETDTVIFEGSRLERFYENVPGQWLGIFLFRDSRGNKIEHFFMNEANFGLNVGSSDTTSLTEFRNDNRTELSMKNVEIRNTLRTAMFAFNSDIIGENCLMVGGTENLVTLGLGGEYYFDNCTFYNQGDITASHDKKVLLISNFASDGQITVINSIDSAIFTNCIIHGTLEDELDLSRAATDQVEYNVRFDHCFLKTINQPDTLVLGYTNNIVNLNPNFVDRANDDFHLSENSPCIDAGKNNGVLFDLDNKVRPNGAGYDIGAYEY